MNGPTAMTMMTTTTTTMSMHRSFSLSRSARKTQLFFFAFIDDTKTEIRFFSDLLVEFFFLFAPTKTQHHTLATTLWCVFYIVPRSICIARSLCKNHFCSKNIVGFLVDRGEKRMCVFFFCYTPFVPPNNKMDFTLHTQYTVLHTQCDFKKFLWNTSMATRKNNGGSHTLHAHRRAHTAHSHLREMWKAVWARIGGEPCGKWVVSVSAWIPLWVHFSSLLLTDWLMSLCPNSSFLRSHTSICVRDGMRTLTRYVTILQAKNCFDLFWCGHINRVRAARRIAMRCDCGWWQCECGCQWICVSQKIRRT